MNTTTCESCQKCSKLKELSEENANLRKEIDNLKRSLMRHPHTPSSRRMYLTAQATTRRTLNVFQAAPKATKEPPEPNQHYPTPSKNQNKSIHVTIAVHP
jgi:hypothetical protein